MSRTQATVWPGTVRTAASASTADVQTAVDASSDGDVVQIPDGTATWTTGITTTKQILIRAENYTPTYQGTMTRSVTITHNSTTNRLFEFTTGNTYHCGLAGIRINEGTGTGINAVRFSGSGSKVGLMSDCALEVAQRNGSSTTVALVAMLAIGGVIWNCRFEGIGTGGLPGVGPDGASINVFNTNRVWETASTLGALDTGGVVNVYLEDSYALNIGQFPDISNHGRWVCRYCDLDGVSGLTHGFTSEWGGRSFEYYNNTFSVTNEDRNHFGRYFWCRAGHGVMTDNVVNNASNTQAYGNVTELDIGDTTTPGTYLQDRQPGCGHNGSAYVSDPIYLWNETGARAHTWGTSNGWDAIVVENRDVFANNGAKPSYSKFTYPHPLRYSTDEAPAVSRGGVSFAYFR